MSPSRQDKRRLKKARRREQERVYSANLALLRVQPPLSRLVSFGGDNNGVTAIDHKGCLQSFYFRSKQVSKLMEHGMVVDNTKVAKVHDGMLLVFLTKVVEEAQFYRVCIRTMLTAENQMLPETSIDVPNVMDWHECAVECCGTSLVCFHARSSRMPLWTMEIATGKTAWQLQRAQINGDVKDVLESHPLWSLFHLFEKFPVQALISKAQTNALVTGQLKLHVSGLHHQQSLLDCLDSVMGKLKSLNKNLTPLNLVSDLHVSASSSVPWCGTHVSVAMWVLELIGFVPVQVCRARDNQLILLRNGQDDCGNTGTEAHEVAKSIWFGPISGVLQHWTGPVVVLTSMGKQSTGKSCI